MFAIQIRVAPESRRSRFFGVHSNPMRKRSATIPSWARKEST